MKHFLLCCYLFLSISVFAQNHQKLVPQNIVFKDTLHNLAFDSLQHNLGEITPVNTTIIKYFKYIGSKPLFITRTWTNDPHYICKYPKGMLEKGKVYSFQVCFWHQGRSGVLSKMMGFKLSNGKTIRFTFAGKYVKAQKSK